MISTTGEYALRAVMYLAQHRGAPQTVAIIAKATKVPQGYLAKILQGLVKESLIVSQRGIKGGFELARPTSSITVLDVLRAVDAGPQRIMRCPLGLPGHQSLCPLHFLLDEACGATERAFASATLQSLLDSAGGIEALCPVPR